MSALVCVIGAAASAIVAGSHLAAQRRLAAHGRSGMVTAEAQDVALSWTEPSRPPPESMVARDASGDTVVVLVGRTYPAASGSGPGQAGLAGTTSAECVLAAYAKRGETFLDDTDGCFAGVLIDKRRKVTLIFNDRYGLGRLYYHQGADGLVVASQVDHVLAAVPGPRSLCRRGLAEMLACGSVLQSRTLFSSVHVLPPASLWRVDDGGVVTRTVYFDASTWEAQSPLAEEEFHAALRATWQDILPKYLTSDQPLAMSLTGGLDGRMIMAWAGKAAGSLPCYTFVGPYRRPVDARIAARVAAACGQTHTDLTIEDDFFAQFPELARQTIEISGGTMDVSGAVELYANRRAAGIAPVRLTGNYGSEILRRHVALRPGKLDWSILTQEAQADIGAATATLIGEQACHPLTYIAFKQVPWHHYARLSIEQSQVEVRSPFLDSALVALAYRSPADLAKSIEPARRLIAAGHPALGGIPTDRGIDLSRPQPRPGLARAWSEFSVRLEYVFDYGMPARLSAVERRLRPLHLERFILGHHKFYHFRVWYRDRLAGYVREVLLDPRSRTRDYLDDGVVERIVEEHTSGTANWTTHIHRLLTLELIQRQFTDRS